MIGLIQRWARQYLYSTGPKTGAPSKVAPGGMSLQGTQPGDGVRLPAEGLNFELFALGDLLARARCAALRWHLITPLAGVAAGIHAAARDFASGATWFADDYLIWRERWPGHYESINVYKDTHEICMTPAKNAAGEACVAIISAHATSGLAYAKTSYDAALSFAQLASPTADPMDGTSACYDADHSCVVGVSLTAGAGSRRFFRIPDASGTMAFATTAPTLAARHSFRGYRNQLVAAGNGIALCAYAVGSASPWTFVAYTSTDGGQVWAQVASPAGSTTGSGGNPATRHGVLGVWFVPDFLDFGPRFVVVTRAADVLQVQHSADGASWATITAPDFLRDLYAGTTGSSHGCAVVLGDCVAFASNESRRAYLWDLRRDSIVALVSHETSQTRYLVHDGLRLLFGGSGSILVSDAVTPPKTVFLGSID